MNLKWRRSWIVYTVNTLKYNTDLLYCRVLNLTICKSVNSFNKNYNILVLLSFVPQCYHMCYISDHWFLKICNASSNFIISVSWNKQKKSAISEAINWLFSDSKVYAIWGSFISIYSLIHKISAFYLHHSTFSPFCIIGWCVIFTKMLRFYLLQEKKLIPFCVAERTMELFYIYYCYD